MVFCDIDGCMGNFVKPEYPLKQDTSKNEQELERIREKTRQFNGILFGVATGRSFYQADHIMQQTGHQGPSVFEMGNVIYDPREGVYNLFERHEKFSSNLDLMQTFIHWKNRMKLLEEEVRKKFQGSDVRQMKDRTCMLTYEFESDIGDELQEYLLGVMAPELEKVVKEGYLKILKSKKAIDILPNLSKGDAVAYLINKYGIDKSSVLAIGDSSHSDLSLLQSAGLVACPDNADNEMKNYVLEHGGFVAPSTSNRGLLNILDLVENFIKFQNLRNESQLVR